MRISQLPIIIMVCAGCASLSGQPVTFAGPGSETLRSPHYRVWLREPGGVFTEQFVYVSTSFDDPGRSISFVQFDYAGEVEVRVEKAGSDADSVILRPARYTYASQALSGNRFRFSFTSDDPEPTVGYASRKISVEFQDGGVENIHEAPRHGLMLFANPPEDAEVVPDTTSDEVFVVPAGRWDREVPAGKRIVHFPPGVFHIADSIWYVPPSVDQVYLAGGAFVRGLLYTQNNPDFLVNGRGVLSGYGQAASEKIPYTQGSAAGQDARHVFFRQGCENLTVEGIALIDHNHHTVTGWFNNPLIRNIKIIGWVFNTDGTRTGDGVVEECFFHCADDAVWVFDDQGTVRNCVFWHFTNGACFQFGWSGGNNAGVRVRQIDVIHAEWSPSNGNANNGIFNLRLQNPSDGEQRDFLFEDIRVETPVLRIFDFDMINETKGDGGTHRMRDITFRNIRARMLTSGSRAWNYFEPWNEMYGFRNFRFENLEINGLMVTEGNWREARFRIDPRSVPEIRFDNPDSIPRVVITFPPHLSEAERGDTLLVAVLAEDPNGTIDSVRVYNHEQLIHASSGSRLAFYYPVTTTRDLALYAEAVDEEGFGYRFGPLAVDVSGRHLVPGRIEAEDYETMGGVQTEPALDEGGGLNVGYIESGNYTSYRVTIESSGTYLARFRVASASAGGTIEVYDNGAILGSVQVVNTGGWQQWTTLSTPLQLEEGDRDLMLYFRGGDGFLFNLNWFEFTPLTRVQAPGELQKEWRLYPVPSRESVWLDGPSGTPVRVGLVNLSGSRVGQWNPDQLPAKLPLDPGIPAGIYLLRVTHPEGLATLKLLVE